MRSDAGVTLTEMVVVLGLLVITIGVVFTTVDVLSGSARTTSTNSTAANDLSYTMELLSKTLMGSKVLYASDDRVVVLVTASGGYEVQTIYVTASGTPSATVGELVWERWSSDASGTAPVGVEHIVWVMSENNANLTASPPIPLFAYYKDATDASQMASSPPDKSTAPDDSVAAFCGTLQGGYNVGAIGRIRLRVAARFSEGIRDNYRDIALRVR